MPFGAVHGVPREDKSAERFIHSLLLHCTTNQRGAMVRDEIKGLRLGEKTSEAWELRYGAIKRLGLFFLICLNIFKRPGARVGSLGYGMEAGHLIALT